MTTVRRWKVRNKFIGTLLGGFKPYGNTRIGLRPTFDWAAKKSCLNTEFKWKTWVFFGQYPKFVPSCTYYISVSMYIYIYIMMGFWGGIWGTVFFFGGDELKCCCPRLEYISGCGLPLPARSKSWSLKMLTFCWWRASILGGAASLNCALDRCPPLWEHDGKTNLRCWQVCQRATRNIFWVN